MLQGAPPCSVHISTILTIHLELAVLRCSNGTQTQGIDNLRNRVFGCKLILQGDVGTCIHFDTFTSQALAEKQTVRSGPDPED
jgi:hypothetical protein